MRVPVRLKEGPLVGEGSSLDSRFGRTARLDQARREYQLLLSVKDPVVRSSFRNTVAYALAQSGATSDAKSVLAEQRREVSTYRLSFAAGHADLIEAMLQTVEGDFEEQTRR